MKQIVKAACAAFILTVIFSLIPFHAQCERISGDTFRLHILANSDSEADQALKLKVRDRILSEMQPLLSSAPDKETAEAVVSGNLQHFVDIAYDEVLQNGCDYPVTAEITNMYFNTRRYDGYTLPAGRYDALRVRIGKAEGHNWWCVLYPGICLSAAEERDRQARESFDSGEYEVIHNEPYSYRFKAVEWLEYLHDLFRRGIND